MENLQQQCIAERYHREQEWAGGACQGQWLWIYLRVLDRPS